MAETYIDVLRSGNDPETEESGQNDALHADLLASTASSAGLMPNGRRNERSPLIPENGYADRRSSTSGTSKVYVALESVRRGFTAIVPSEKSKERYA